MENLVLSGGGVNGIVELGSLKALEKLNLNYKKNSRLNYLLRFYI